MHSDQVSDLYRRALACPPAQREGFLRQACGHDEALREEVESLLRFEADSERFLERPAAAFVGVVLDQNAGMIGRGFGPYILTSRIGAGGMGEVYRARDTKLGRDVAMKILPPHFMDDAERRARFAREARLLATLNHPHIGAIYGLEEADGVTGLVLELVEGETLADRLTRGALKLADAVTIARQIADALSAAHDKGIVHRDLKPSNVVIQSDGSDLHVKVLDFGLAKSVAPSDVDDLTLRRSLAGTEDGRILGTPAYMSPEQARGQSVDKRTDIWAFGCVLFEMLSGQLTFHGQTVTDTLARILEREPDWSVLPRETPRAVRRLLERSLRKDPQKRLRDIADAAIEIDEAALTGLPTADEIVSIHMRRRRRLTWIAAGSVLVTAAIVIAAVSSSPPVDSARSRYVEFSVEPPPGAEFTPQYVRVAVSPDGAQIAFTAFGRNRSILLVRPLATSESKAIPATDGARLPFWSPDSREIGFFANGRLKTVPVEGGTPFDVCDAEVTLDSRQGGATWSSNDVIVFAGDIGPLRKVSARGGPVTMVTALQSGDVAHQWPFFLPDDQRFLYFAQRQSGAHEVRVGSLGSPETRSLGPFESSAIYASGHLLFLRGGRLVARRFDVSALRMHEDQFVIAEPELPGATGTQAVFSASGSGVLAYLSRGMRETQLTWLDRNGRPLGTVGQPGRFTNLDLSPDEKRVAVSLRDNGNNDIWIVDLSRNGDRFRLTDDPGQDFDPSWSSDGRWIAFHSTRVGTRSLFKRAIDGREDELLFKAETSSVSAPDWSPDGSFILAPYLGDLWQFPTGASEQPSVFSPTAFRELQNELSRDGQWVAFSSDQSGSVEIYIRHYPSGAGPYKVSLQGGTAPRWRADGKEVYFLSPDMSMMSARISSGKPTSIPERLFQTTLSRRDQKPYVVSKDGQRFLMPVADDSARATSLTVVLDWMAKAPN